MANESNERKPGQDKKPGPATDEALAILSAAHVKAFPEAHADEADKAARDLLRDVTATIRKAGFEVHDAEGVMVVKTGPQPTDLVRMSADAKGVHLATGDRNSASAFEDVPLEFDALHNVWAPAGTPDEPNPPEPARPAAVIVAERLRDLVEKARPGAEKRPT